MQRLVATRRGARDGTAPAQPTIEAIFTAHVAFVWRSLRQLGVAESDLEDEIQEVFIVAHRRLSGWDEQHPRAWLYAIARRCASAYRRRSHRHHERCCESPPERSDPRDPHAHLEAERARRALEALDHDKRAVFVLREIEEMSMQEVAQALECSIFTAYSRLYAARRALVRALEEGP